MSRAATATLEAPPTVMRRCACGGKAPAGGECEACRKKRQGIQRSASSSGSPRAVPRVVHDVLGSSGTPLDTGTREFMESRLGHSFADVRVHADARAAASAAAVSAHAYAVGRNVVFGAGKYAPGSGEGRRLIAHELAHVVQQSGAPASAHEHVDSADSAYEREADRVADAAVSPGHEPAPAPVLSARRQVSREDDSTAPAAPAAAPAAAPTRVAEVRISCDSDTIEFDTDAGVYAYELGECSVPDLEWVATVAILNTGGRPDVRFSRPPAAPDAVMEFTYRISPGQPNPSTFFPSQTTVPMRTGTLARPVPGPPGPQTPVTPPSPGPEPGPDEVGPVNGWSGPLVCARPLDLGAARKWPLRYIRHAFINDPPHNYAIRNLLAGNGFTESCAEKVDPSASPDDPATSVCKPCRPRPGQSLADLSACLAGVHGAYPSPNRYRNLPDLSDWGAWGPNSNSYAAAMASCCHNFSPAGLGALPGWNHSPAGPCRRPIGEIPPLDADSDSPDAGTPDAGVPDADVPSAGVPAAPCLPVAPGGSPNVTNPAPNNTCTPDPAGSVLGWDVVEADPDNWGVCVSSLTLTGQINIKPWPSAPTSMTVPNTANPVDGGNINNTAGSNNHWQYVMNDMADYDNATGGGAGLHWHSTAASEAHEWAHWTGDYVPDAVGSAAGGDWPNRNTALNALREPKASSPTQGAARTALEPRVLAIRRQWQRDTVTRWNTLISTTDHPGGGGRGYAAGMRVLNGLIGSVRTYKDSKGW